jgi:hypothetical protein
MSDIHAPPNEKGRLMTKREMAERIARNVGLGPAQTLEVVQPVGSRSRQPNGRFQTPCSTGAQPLGVPFYGLPDQGWIVAMWSFKNSLGVGFIAGTLLDPEPPVAKMAGPWNRGSTAKTSRRTDIMS